MTRSTTGQKNKQNQSHRVISILLISRSLKEDLIQKIVWTTLMIYGIKIDPSRTDIDTWADLIDLEEGRLPPKKS